MSILLLLVAMDVSVFRSVDSQPTASPDLPKKMAAFFQKAAFFLACVSILAVLLAYQHSQTSDDVSLEVPFEEFLTCSC